MHPRIASQMLGLDGSDRHIPRADDRSTNRRSPGGNAEIAYLAIIVAIVILGGIMFQMPIFAN